jgi:hypothetical protein
MMRLFLILTLFSSQFAMAQTSSIILMKPTDMRLAAVSKGLGEEQKFQVIRFEGHPRSTGYVQPFLCKVSIDQIESGGECTSLTGAKYLKLQSHQGIQHFFKTLRDSSKSLKLAFNIILTAGGLYGGVTAILGKGILKRVGGGVLGSCVVGAIDVLEVCGELAIDSALEKEINSRYQQVCDASLESVIVNLPDDQSLETISNTLDRFLSKKPKKKHFTGNVDYEFVKTSQCENCYNIDVKNEMASPMYRWCEP